MKHYNDIETVEHLTPGNQLDVADRREVLAAYVHRFTGEHRPSWANDKRPDGSVYPVQFANDADWLANTRFATNANGRLDRRVRSCVSSPTWPNNPELRAGQTARQISN